MYSYLKYTNFRYRITLIIVIVLVLLFNLVIYLLGYENIKDFVSYMFLSSEMINNLNNLYKNLNSFN